MRLSLSQAQRYGLDRQGTRKYRNVPVTIEGRRFDSKREAARYAQLRLLEHAGEICRLECQPRFPLVVNGERVASYVGDFRYVIAHSGEVVTEDAKGVKTPAYRLKAKLVRALYGFDVVEV